jgi:hypothetical protein
MNYTVFNYLQVININTLTQLNLIKNFLHEYLTIIEIHTELSNLKFFSGMPTRFFFNISVVCS